MIKHIILVASLLLTAKHFALDTTEFAKPEMQQRYHALVEELRCLVCQNETIAGSNAPLARDLRQKVAEQLRAGKSDEEIREYLVERYGEFVTYRPSKQGAGRFLWVAPVLFIFVALILFVVITRRNSILTNGGIDG